MKHDPAECLIFWPTDPTEGDLIASYLRPQHVCALPADHVNLVQTSDGRTWRRVKLMPAELEDTQPVEHRCRCGATLPVRDVEVAS